MRLLQLLAKLSEFSRSARETACQVPLICCAMAISAAAFGDDPGNSKLHLAFTPVGDRQLAPHGSGNVYAPDILIVDGTYRMWFGGQGRDGHDRIQLAESSDGITWQQRGVVLDVGSANHVNDPSVVRVGGKYFMYYTYAQAEIRDEIALAISDDGVHWTPKGVVLSPRQAGSWDSLLVGRPSVLVEDGLFRMWYDARKDLPPGAPATGIPTSVNSTRAVGYAESKDGIHWIRPQSTSVFEHDAGGVHVSRVLGGYLMLYESRDGTLAAISQDGRTWKPKGLLCGLSANDTDRYGHVTPFFLYDSSTLSGWLYLGAARGAAWDRNVIARRAIRPARLQAVFEGSDP